MNVFIPLFALVAIAAAAPDRTLQAVFQAKFNAFKAKHGKQYNPEEEHIRLSNFLQNTYTVETHNERYARGLESYFLRQNELADLSHEEYLNTRLGAVRPEAQEKNVTYFKPTEGWTPPDSIDWRIWDHVQRVKNQGGCGSCYSFSAVGAIESQWMRQYNTLPDLSEQQLVDCSGSHGNGGCEGGWMHNCFKYIIDVKGLNRQDTYPYEGEVGQCRYNPDDAAVQLAEYAMIPEDDEEALKVALASIGPVSIAYDASTREHMMYGGGIYDSPNCDKYRTSHAVLCVGYGTENDVDFWTLKNSWGEEWGEKGFFRMRRNTGNRCGVVTASSYPIVLPNQQSNE